MKDAFIVNEVNRYDVKGRKYIGIPLKYYFEDVGLRNARLGFRQVEETHLMENIIYNELRVRGYRVDVGVVVKRGRTDKDMFPCTRNSRFNAIFVVARNFKMREMLESKAYVEIGVDAEDYYKIK